MTPEEKLAKLKKLKQLKELKAQKKQDPSLLDKVGAVGRGALNQGNLFMGGPLSDELFLAPAATVGTTLMRGLDGQGVSLGQIKNDYSSNLGHIQDSIEKDREVAPIGTAIGEIGGNIVTGGALGLTGAGTKAGAILGSGNTAARIGKGAVAGSAAAGGYTLAQEEGNISERLGKSGVTKPSISNPLFVGGSLGGGIPAAGRAINAVSDVFSPAIDASKKPIIELAKKYNVPLGLDDLTDSTFYNTLLSEGKALPLSGAQKHTDKAQKAYNKAIAKTFGQDSDAITPTIISKAYTDLGNKFNKLTKGKTFEVGDDFYEKVDELREAAGKGVYGVDGDKFLEKQLNDITKFVDGGSIEGVSLDTVRRKLNKTSRGNSAAADIANDLEELTIDMITSGDGAAKKVFSELKYQYKNLKTVQGIVLKDQVDGNVSPSLLTQRVKSKFGEDNFARGEAGELGELAMLGQAMKDSIPNSGTSQRQLARNLLTGNAAGAVPTYMFGGAPAAAAQLGLSGVGILGNRALQNRNFNEKVIQKAISGSKRPQSMLFTSPNAGLLAGSSSQ